MKVKLAYGQGHLEAEFPDGRTTVITPAERAGLADEKSAFLHALDNPTASEPLRARIKPADKICILFTDLTRATPNARIIPWLLEYLSFVPRENLTLLKQLGTHRPNTQSELEKMLTADVVRNYRVLNHEPENEAALVQLGTTKDGTPALLNRHAVAADLRIVTGFIEPHFFAGFSGGPKGLMPGVAGLRTVMSNHGAKNIGDSKATFGVTFGNPLWEELREIALRTGPTFLTNVTLNEHRAITNVFTGDLTEAHRAGCAYVEESAKQRVAAIRKAGASEVHLRISSPPVMFPCHFGIDTPKREKLIATQKTLEEIRRFVGADSLGYLSREGMLASISNIKSDKFCTACFDGNYPLKVQDKGKYTFEKRNINLYAQKG